MSNYLSDAEYEEEIRCAALGLDGPNAKLVRGELWADWADHARKAEKENAVDDHVFSQAAFDRAANAPDEDSK